MSGAGIFGNGIRRGLRGGGFGFGFRRAGRRRRVGPGFGAGAGPPNICTISGTKMKPPQSIGGGRSLIGAGSPITLPPGSGMSTSVPSSSSGSGSSGSCSRGGPKGGGPLVGVAGGGGTGRGDGCDCESRYSCSAHGPTTDCQPVPGSCGVCPRGIARASSGVSGRKNGLLFPPRPARTDAITVRAMIAPTDAGSATVYFRRIRRNFAMCRFAAALPLRIFPAPARRRFRGARLLAALFFTRRRRRDRRGAPDGPASAESACVARVCCPMPGGSNRNFIAEFPSGWPCAVHGTRENRLDQFANLEPQTRRRAFSSAAPRFRVRGTPAWHRGC